MRHIPEHEQSDAPGCVNRTDADAMHNPKAVPTLINGVIYFPSTGSDVAADLDYDDKTAFVIVQLRARTCGLFSSLSPDGAREFADGLKRATDDADSAIATYANEAINAARTNGGPTKEGTK